MMITVSRTQLSIGLTAIRRFEKANIQDIDSVAAFRIGKNVRVVKRSLAEPPVLAHFGPGRAGIIGTEDAAIFIFDNRIDPLRIGV